MKNEDFNQKLTDTQWETIILRHELRALTREKEHLLAKEQERQLDPWERIRLNQVLDEMMELLPQFGSLALVGNNTAHDSPRDSPSDQDNVTLFSCCAQ